MITTINNRENDDVGSRVLASVAHRLTEMLAMELKPALYVVATPIGNLGDMSLRAIAVLARCDTICCEDTRHSRILLQRYFIDRPLRTYNDHSGDGDRARIVDDVSAGKCVALISDAGTPLISDPGYKLVRDLRASGHDVIAIPGASAAIAALSIAGLATDRFLFEGFLPARSGSRRRRLNELNSIAATAIIYEAPGRIADLMTDIAELMPGRQVCIGREMTKLHEEIRCGTPQELSQWANEQRMRGEFVVLLGPPVAGEVSDTDIAQAMRESLDHLSLRDAAREVGERMGIGRKRAYDIGLQARHLK